MNTSNTRSFDHHRRDYWHYWERLFCWPSLIQLCCKEESQTRRPRLILSVVELVYSTIILLSTLIFSATYMLGQFPPDALVTCIGLYTGFSVGMAPFFLGIFTLITSGRSSAQLRQVELGYIRSGFLLLLIALLAGFIVCPVLHWPGWNWLFGVLGATALWSISAREHQWIRLHEESKAQA
jgi:hypothetical protein